MIKNNTELLQDIFLDIDRDTDEILMSGEGVWEKYHNISEWDISELVIEIENNLDANCKMASKEEILNALKDLGIGLQTQPIIDQIDIVIKDDDNYPEWLVTEYDEENQTIIHSDQYSQSDVEELGWETVFGYIKEDEARIKAYEHGDWGMVGVYAKAVVKYEIYKNNWRLENLSSGGIWGIESDCGEEFLHSEIDGQILDLKGHLERFNVDTSKMDELIIQAKERARVN